MLGTSKPPLNNTQIPQTSRSGKQELLVEINIGKKGDSKCIRLCDINNMTYVEQEIKWFIKNNGLKDSAFSFIKQIIAKQISQKRQETYFECHSKCPHNCRCQQKMSQYQERQKQILDTISFSDHERRRSSKSPGTQPKQPHHIQIKITPKIENISTNARNQRNDEISSFVFNSSFTLPSSIGEKQRVFLTDQLFENVLDTTENKSSTYFSNMSEFKSKEREKENKFTVKNKQFAIKINEKNVKPLQSSFKKNSMTTNTPTRTKIKLNFQAKSPITATTPKICKQNKPLSTRQRKDALMTPQQPKAKDENTTNIVVLNSQSLQSMVMEHKKAIKQSNMKLVQAPTIEHPVTKSHPPTISEVLLGLFKKLTANNPPQMKQLHSQYVSYQLLEREQLHFMGILFQKIDHKELNNLNFTNFKANSLKYCWKQLEELIINMEIRNTIEHHKKIIV